jgi:hypothetical protein
VAQQPTEVHIEPLAASGRRHLGRQTSKQPVKDLGVMALQSELML